MAEAGHLERQRGLIMKTRNRERIFSRIMVLDGQDTANSHFDF
jgi:hypothetical protein